jgi:hypothetical protein
VVDGGPDLAFGPTALEFTVLPVLEFTVLPVVEFTVLPVVEFTVLPVVEFTVLPVVEFTVLPVVEFTVLPERGSPSRKASWAAALPAAPAAQTRAMRLRGVQNRWCIETSFATRYAPPMHPIRVAAIAVPMIATSKD